MPIYDYQCPNGHRVEKLRKYAARDDDLTCEHEILLSASIVACLLPMTRILSAPHVEPDGIYSHERNMGNADAFDRRYEENKARRR